MMESRRSRSALIAFSAAAMFAWIVYLRFDLPRTYAAQHWRGAWLGFDIALFASLLGTLINHFKGSERVIPFSIVAATMLFIDTWFDVVTSQRGSDRYLAFAMAIFLQIPLAIRLIKYSKATWELLTSRSSQ